MILKDKNTTSLRWSPKIVGMLLLGGLILAFVSIFFINNKSVEDLPEGGILCDAETVVDGMFKTGAYLFEHGEKQNGQRAHTGKYSCKLLAGAKRQYGFGYKMKDPIPGMTYRASVWRFRNDGGKSLLAVKGNEGSGFYKEKQFPVEVEGEWEKIEILFSIPIKEELEDINIFVYSSGEGNIYFDDLSIVPLGSLSSVLADDFNLDTIRLTVSDKGIRKISKKREEALEKGLLETNDDDWVKGHLSSKEGESKKVKLRLKGDWLNHLRGDKWSFRIKLLGGEAWKKLRHFSLHRPEARANVHEWLLHKLLEQEDVLTTRYDFVLLELNGKSLGVYAIEEHFDKVLAESRDRREGVMVKFSESGFWGAIKQQLHHFNGVTHGVKQNEQTMQTSEVLPFGEKTTISNPILRQQFEQAQHLLQQYQFGNLSIEEVFDVDRFARYFAICETMGAYHGIAWHNLRFYYNPLSAKLEPIGYDGFEYSGSYRGTLIGHGALNPNRLTHAKFYFRLFLDEAFVEKYVHYIYEYTKKENLETFFRTVEGGLYAREQLIQNEYPKYDFDFGVWLRDAAIVQILTLPQNDISLKVYTQNKNQSTKDLKVGNVFALPIKLIGYGTSEKTMSTKLQEPVTLEGYYTRSIYDILEKQKEKEEEWEEMGRFETFIAYRNQIPLRFKELEVPAGTTHLFYKPIGIDTLMHSRIAKWPSPYDPKIEEGLLTPSKIVANDLYRIEEDVLFFPKGKHELKEPLVVPKGHRLHFEAGCQIDLQQGAFIWSSSPVTFRGTAEERVLIHSEDGTGRGFHVMDPKGKSILEYALFEGLNTVDVKERRVTGAVTFYESDVNFDHCVLRKNKCEDALNLIRSEFRMENSVIAQTFADGFDADFCKGRIKRTQFINTGNDGLDISGSTVLLELCDFENIGDKGISVGEASDATIYSATITNAPIAIASKDLSTAVVLNISLTDCRQGFVAFQKKPEYGPGKIVVQDYQTKGVTKLYNTEGQVIFQAKEKKK